MMFGSGSRSVVVQWRRPETGGPAGPASTRRLGGVFLLTGVLFIVLAALTLGLWKAEMGLARHFPSRSATYVLWGGLTISVLMSAAVLQALLHRAREQERTRRQLEAIESLHAVSMAIGAQLTAGTALDALASASHRLLGMDRAGIAMLKENQTLEVVAAAGAMPHDFPKFFDLQDLPASSHCLETNACVFEGDMLRPTRPYGRLAVRAFDAKSLILIPLRLENRPIGLLTLSSSRPREFSDLDHRIAELLGSEASVMLANQQLYQQMRTALESSQRLLRQRQAIWAANAAVRSHGALDDMLSQIVRLVPSAIGTDVCGMTLLTGPSGQSVLAAVSPPYEKLIGRQTGPNPVAEEAFKSRKPLIIADAHSDPRLHSSWQSIRDVGSILYIPMFRSDREPLGILALSRHQTGSFTQEQIELGQTFSALVALAVENTRLLEQTRDDAETKTVLLRELNHRVKNNLAGIVGLLELKPPSMPAEVRQWLDRATDRIRSMASAHQLFAGGVVRVPLDSLVAQTLAASTVNKNGTVHVKTELNGVRQAIGPEQAVALAMVLNELCHNALVHGLRQGGTLTIRAREGRDSVKSPAGPGDKIVIEVADEGRGCPEPIGDRAQDGASAAPVSVSSGFGLELVEGLVRRELKGRFALQSAPNGTTATLEFPLPREEQ
jgi:two-component sensor histidine kinase